MIKRSMSDYESDYKRYIWFWRFDYGVVEVIMEG